VRLRANALLLALLAGAPVSAASASAWRLSDAQVRVTCPLTVGGSFDATTRALSGALTEAPSPQPFGGSIDVDLRTLDSGIGLRDDHMQKTYLEVGRGGGFDKAVLTDLRVSGVDPHAFQGHTTFSATLLLHGTTRAIAGQATVKRDAAAVHVEATFAVKLSDYGVPKPQYLGVGVKDEVQIKVSLVATPGPGAEGAGR
jgi:polyisoprenoid-binding protein YceI